MTQVRMARPTFSTEQGGRLEVNQIVDVQDSEHEKAAATVARWKRIGLAVDAEHTPFDVPASRADRVAELERQLLQAQAELADLRAPLGSAPSAPVRTDGAASPFDSPSLAFPGPPPADVRDEDDAEADEADDDATLTRETAAARPNRGRRR